MTGQSEAIESWHADDDSEGIGFSKGKGKGKSKGVSKGSDNDTGHKKSSKGK